LLAKEDVASTSSRGVFALKLAIKKRKTTILAEFCFFFVNVAKPATLAAFVAN
jgi:hypothetical protein